MYLKSNYRLLRAREAVNRFSADPESLGSFLKIRGFFLTFPAIFWIPSLYFIAGQVNRSVLEEYVPYALMHAGYLDMSRQSSVSA